MIRRLLEPSKIFFIIILIFLWIPSFFIYTSKFYTKLWVSATYDDYDNGALLFMLLVSLSLLFFISGKYFWYAFIDGSKRKGFIKRSVTVNNIYAFQINKFFFSKQRYLFILALGTISVFFILLYILNGGFQKMLLLGSGLTPKEFRFAETFANENSGVMALLQIARRVFLPLVIVVYSIKRSFNEALVDSKYYFFLIFVFLISVLITFDRAPLITFLLVFSYIWFLKTRVNYFFYFKIPIIFFSVLLLGGLMTFLQHNITKFNFFDVLEAGFQFLWHRVWAAPAIVGIELSTIMFPCESDKLNLRYSRIMVLFGAERVGSQEDASIFVGPVSYIGDIWRNLGASGILFISFFLGLLMGFFDYVYKRIQIPLSAGLGILTITFAFYLTHGVFFSLGVFFQMFFMIFFAVYSLKYYGVHR